MPLSSLLDALADQAHVFTRCGENTDADIAQHVCELALVAQQGWGTVNGPGPHGPSAADVKAALHRIDADTAAARMARIATTDLAWGDTLLGPEVAADAARQLVSQLGSDAVWWSNEVDVTPTSRAWTPVSGCTFDAVIAGVGATHFVVLLQVAED